VSHLIRLGHRRIAHIQGPPEYLVSHDRYQGYRKALLDAGMAPDPELVLTGDFLPPSGRACAIKLFELPLEKRPTAIFASADQMAYGVLAAAEEFGLSVPQDIALVGFDDDVPSVHTRPPLTTVRQPYLEMGQRGIELLLSMLDKPGLSRGGLSTLPRTSGASKKGYESPTSVQSVRIQLPTHLVVRASCGADYHISLPTSSDTATL
jgi:LacI family transcriptional regulator